MQPVISSIAACGGVCETGTCLATQQPMNQRTPVRFSEVTRTADDSDDSPASAPSTKSAGILLCAFASLLLAFAENALAIGQSEYLEAGPAPGSFSIVEGRAAAGVYVDVADHAGVVRAVNDLRADVARVSGCAP